MPTPTIPAGNLYFNATLWTGNYPSSQTITNGVAGQNFAPDLVWIKGRSYVDFHTWFDTVRGATKSISSDLTTAEVTRGAALTAFTSTGFTLGSDTLVNPGSGNTVVGWQWKAGGTAVSNTDGTITSSVSANTTSGFSVVTYTGTGSNGSVGHGLSVLGIAPAMIIVKRRDSGAGATNWLVYHSQLNNGTNPAQYNLKLNLTNAIAGASTIWNDTSPTSTVFSVGTNAETNGSGGTFVAYCWAPIAGYSAFGSYTGNGSTDGSFVYLGFRPRFVMVKRTDTSGYGWIILDTARNPYNVSGNYLSANTSDAENNLSGPDSIDFLSNGWKNRYGSYINDSGGTYIYAAFAENPFKYANAR